MPTDCAQPLHFLATEVHTSTGDVRRRVVDGRCGTRLASKCPGCSELYVGDARRMVGSGTDAPALSWMTLTAPGAGVFGAVHSGPDKLGRRRRCKCGLYHRPDTKALGTPIDPSTYDYERAARFNSHVSRLFTVLVQKLRRLTGQELQLVRVVEFQRRGLAHIHALVRGTIDEDTLRLAIRGGINPATGRRISRTTSGGFAFGPQCDVRPVENARRVGAYLRKLLAYAVKDAADGLGNGSAHAIAMRTAAAHTVRCECPHYECRDGVTSYHTPGGRSQWSCRRHRAARSGWGFRGHILAATRRWGLTLGAIRDQRRQHVATDVLPVWEPRSFELVSADRAQRLRAAAVP
jgi:hypothetical protein